MKKKSIIILLICTITFFVSGCTESRNNVITINEATSLNESSNTNSDISEENGINNEQNNAISDYIVIDGIKIKNKIISTDIVKSFGLYSVDNDCYILDSLSNLFDQQPSIEEMDYGSNGIAYRLKSVDGSFGYINPNCINYYSSNGLALASFVNSLKDDYDTLEEFPFCSSTEAINNSIKLFENIGIKEKILLNSIVSVSEESYSNYVNQIISDLDSKDEKEAAKIELYENSVPYDFYYISFYLAIDNIPVLTDDDIYQKQFQSTVYGTVIDICYSSNGIEYLYVNSTGHVAPNKHTQMLNYANTHSAKDLIINKFNQQIKNDNILVENIERVYIYSFEKESRIFLPCWKFTIYFEKSNSYNYYYFKATDGEEVF